MDDKQPRRSGEPERVDVQLDDATMARAAADFASLQSLGEVNTTISSWMFHGSDLTDGPCGIDQWRCGGEVVDGKMTHKQHLLATHLYRRIGRKVPIADLIGNGQIFENVQDSTVQRHGSEISKWFADRNVPLVVSTRDRHIWMEKP